jgi:hypothetical protein
MSIVRPFPRRVLLPDWVVVSLIIAVVVGEILTDSVWFIVGLVLLLLVQGIDLFVIVSCPDCSGRLQFCRVNVPGGKTRYTLQLRCKKCRNIWDTGRVRDDSYFNS